MDRKTACVIALGISTAKHLRQLAKTHTLTEPDVHRLLDQIDDAFKEALALLAPEPPPAPPPRPKLTPIRGGRS